MGCGSMTMLTSGSLVWRLCPDGGGVTELPTTEKKKSPGCLLNSFHFATCQYCSMPSMGSMSFVLDLREVGFSGKLSFVHEIVLRSCLPSVSSDYE